MGVRFLRERLRVEPIHDSRTHAPGRDAPRPARPQRMAKQLRPRRPAGAVQGGLQKEATGFPCTNFSRFCSKNAIRDEIGVSFRALEPPCAPVRARRRCPVRASEIARFAFSLIRAIIWNSTSNRWAQAAYPTSHFLNRKGDFSLPYAPTGCSAARRRRTRRRTVLHGSTLDLTRNRHRAGSAPTPHLVGTHTNPTQRNSRFRRSKTMLESGL